MLNGPKIDILCLVTSLTALLMRMRSLLVVHRLYNDSATEEDPLPPCTEVFFATMGLHCSHMIKDRVDKDEDGRGRILLRDIGPHWRFSMPKSDITATEDFVFNLSVI